ncbi:MAG TPA: hypothetical protein VFW89_04575 [Gemmatimonadaceae bacterium]|nr:hypothetical protein [Gemmatimonadaceae bacterium]
MTFTNDFRVVTRIAGATILALVTACSDATSPAPVRTWASLSAGDNFTCGLTTTGAAFCWGSNNVGQLGDGSKDSSMGYQRLAPVAVTGGLTFRSLTAGDLHVCALTASGMAYCWGADDAGQLGDAALHGSPGAFRDEPVAVQGGLAFSSLAGGGIHTCGVTQSGATYCWGLNVNGQLGNDSIITRTVPVAVVGGLDISSVAAGFMHSCAITTEGAAYCWGNDIDGALGTAQVPGVCPSFGALSDVVPCIRSPAPVWGTSTFAQISGGYDHTCGVTRRGEAYCWGDNGDGQLGNNSASGVDSLPVQVSGDLTFTLVSGGWGSTCAVTAGGAAYCWGDNSSGELGDGSTTLRRAPVQVSGGLQFASVTVGNRHACGVTVIGNAYCWGLNTNGELGDSSTANSLFPVEVLIP